MSYPKSLTNYKSRFSFDKELGLGHPNNRDHILSLSKMLMDNVKRCAKPYHKKYNTKDNGTPGKRVSIKLDDIVNKLIESDGIGPNGEKLCLLPALLQKNANQAVKDGRMTLQEKANRISVDRIDNNRGYHKDNIQISTISSNRARNVDNMQVFNNKGTDVIITVAGVKLELTDVSADYLAEYTHSLQK